VEEAGVPEPETGAGQWLSQSEAGLRLGWKLNRVISARRSGRLQGRKGNRGEWLVRVPDGLGVAGAEPGYSQVETEPAAELREELAELKHALGRAEGRSEALLQQVSSLAENLAAERARGDRLETALAEARKSWLERLIEAVRR
jgi:hypothetical protein